MIEGRFTAIITIFGICTIKNGNVVIGGKKVWTEQDEARRIQQIVEAEEMEYEMEQRSQSVIDGDVMRGDYHNYPITESYQYKRETTPAVTLPSMIATTSGDSFWCYHCASPLSIMSGNMQRAIEKFLRIRRTAYPAQVKNTRCSEPRNLTELVVEHCRHPYCQTLILTDHETGKYFTVQHYLSGSAFTMRGCAETFGAINEKLLDARDDNTCQRLHEQLDIQECICKHRQYCYPGAKRRLFGASAATVFMASAPTDNVLSIFYYVLLICLKFTFYDHF
uniref:Phlebovirus glycoprotein G2 fusion domain-containing protein n=1 Tax=Elaeophora elaphi TaxID=1147741 RepID=A0A0R3RTA4_9BILA